MPVAVWLGPAGSVAVELLRGGRCHIFHEDARAVSEADLLGLPASWEVGGARYCGARLACGHTFHVSALAWHCLYRDMRCPMCRRGCDCRMQAGLPERERGAFERRLAEAAAADAAEAAAEAAEAAEAETEAETEAEPESSDGEHEEDAGGPVAYAELAGCERQLRLVVEVRCGAREVYVYESPLHGAGQDAEADAAADADATDGALADAADASLSLRPFRVQRSFARHVCSCVARCARRGALPISLHFSLAHPLFRGGVESGAVVSPRAGLFDFALRCVPPRGAALETMAPPAQTVGVVRVRLGAGRVQLALEPLHLAALWCAGL